MEHPRVERGPRARNVRDERVSSSHPSPSDHLTIWTIGHSTRSTDELFAVLRAFEIELVADVRRFAGSRRLPHFGAESLQRSLAEGAITYRHIPALGGRRAPLADSSNTGWRHPAFRGYADYIATEEFAAGLFELLMLANGLRTAIMCAELLWWRCHRRIIADVLVSLGVDVIHLRDATHSAPHRLAPPGRLVSGLLTYGSS